MTIPRELALNQIDGQLLLTSKPVAELTRLAQKPISVTSGHTKVPEQYILEFSSSKIDNYKIVLSNDMGEQLVIGYDKSKRAYYIDRSRSGKIDFNTEFGKVANAPRFTNTDATDIKLVVDQSSVEFFADGGATVMTSIFFPSKPYNHVKVNSIKRYRIIPLKSIW